MIIGPPKTSSSRRLGPPLGKNPILPSSTLDKPPWVNTKSTSVASSPQVTAPSSEDGDNSEKLTKFTKDARQGSIASVESKDNNSESIDLDLATNAEVVNKQVISLLDADSSLAGKEDNNKKSADNSGAASKGWDALKRGIKSLSKRGNEISSLDEGKEEKKSSMTPFFLAAEESKERKSHHPRLQNLQLSRYQRLLRVSLSTQLMT